jgi:hypothetical protein
MRSGLMHFDGVAIAGTPGSGFFNAECQCRELVSVTGESRDFQFAL